MLEASIKIHRLVYIAYEVRIRGNLVPHCTFFVTSGGLGADRNGSGKLSIKLAIEFFENVFPKFSSGKMSLYNNGFLIHSYLLDPSDVDKTLTFQPLVLKPPSCSYRKSCLIPILKIHVLTSCKKEIKCQVALPGCAMSCLQFLIVVFPDHTHFLVLPRTVWLFRDELNKSNNTGARLLGSP